MNRRWVIQKDKIFYLFCNGEYRGPFTAAEMPVVAPVLLSPASTAGVETYMATKTGWRPKTGYELAQEYGQIAYKIELDFCAQKSSFKEHVLTEAPCPRRDLVPKHSADVADWLELLAGTTHDLVLDWLAVSLRLDRPCSALYLEGAKGAGKTLFAHGVAALWNDEGPVALEDAFANFNSSMIGCPVVFADEHMPTDFHGQVKTGQLRQFIQGRSRTLKRKFIPDARLRGCVRLILAANHQDMIQTTEHLTLHDIQAIVERVLHVPIKGDSAEECAAALFLEELSKDKRPITPDDIAQHVLHLAATRQVDDKNRFLVTGSQTTLHRRLTTGSGLRSAVCHWLCMFLHEPAKIEATKSLLVRRYKGKLLATSRGLTRFWGLYETNVRPPPVGPISKALAGIALDKKLLTAGDGRRTWYWVIDPENLAAWSTDNNFAERESLMELIAADEPAPLRRVK